MNLAERVTDWKELPLPQHLSNRAWAHHGVAFNDRKEVVVLHDRRLVILDRAGTGRSVPVAIGGGHGLTLVHEGADEVLWVADCGRGSTIDAQGTLNRRAWSGSVVRLSLDGRILGRLEDPPQAPTGSTYRPSAVAVDESRFGGDGAVWVADGYGSNLVHRYDANGRLRMSLTGEETGRPFDCPHDVLIDRREHDARLYIADRGNARVCVYDLGGRFERSLGDDVLTSPSGLTSFEDHLLVAELHGRLVMLDREGRTAGILGENPGVTERPGWPNAFDGDGGWVRPGDLRPGLFNSPHSIATDEVGSVAVVEWLIGGRCTLLDFAPVPGSGS